MFKEVILIDIDNNDKGGIYKLVNLVNSKIYVGSAVNFEKRKKEHFDKLKCGNGVNKHLQASFNKYGRDNFIFEILEIVEDKDKLIEREQYWIDKLNVCDKNIGYNKRPKAESNLGLKMSEESKLKMKNNFKGKHHSTETKEKLRQNNLGKKASQETKKKLSESHKGKTSHMLGKHHTEETKRKVSESKKGKMIGDKHPNVKLTCKQVVEIKKMLQEGKYATDIAKIFNVSSSTIKQIKYGKAWTYINIEMPESSRKPIKNLCVEEVIQIKQLINKGIYNLTKIAKMFNVDISTISLIKRGKSWSHVQIPI